MNSMPPLRSGPSGKTIVAFAGLAFLCKVVLALRTYGTNDMAFYESWRVVHYLGALVNNPPSMFHLLRLDSWMSGWTGVPFPFWFRLRDIVADAGTLLLVWKILGLRVQEPSIRWAVLMLAVAPTSILISGFHGNTDPAMTFFLLLAVYLIDRSEWSAGAAFGMSMCFKVVPIVTIPILFLHLARFRKQVIFFGTAGMVVLLLWSPYLFQNPKYILTQIFGYRSLYGNWGVSFVMSRLASQTLNATLQSGGVFWLLAAIVLVSVWMSQPGKKQDIYLQVGVVLFLFLSVSNAFGVQYLAWVVPFVVGLGAAPAAVYYVASGTFLLVVYDFWSKGMPWYLANSNEVGDYSSQEAYFLVMCWLAVIGCCLLALYRVSGAKPMKIPLFAAGRQRDFWFGGALLAVVLFAYPASRELLSRPARVDARKQGETEVRHLRVDQAVQISAELLASRKFPGALSAANDALALDPAAEEPYNHLVLAYAGMNRWNEAVLAAKTALQLHPESRLARDNLAWAEEHLSKEPGPL